MDFESEKWKAKTLAGKGELRDERGSRDEEGKKKKEKKSEEKRNEEKILKVEFRIEYF